MTFLLILKQKINNWNMSQKIRILLGKNIENLRKNKKITREDLSLMLNFDNSYISKLEKGKINITIDRLEKIADFFEIEPYILLSNVGCNSLHQ